MKNSLAGELEVEGLNKRVQRLEAALSHAEDIINSYQMDIRDAKYWLYIHPETIDLVALGFCQGTIYLKALDDIKRLKNGE